MLDKLILQEAARGTGRMRTLGSELINFSALTIRF